MIILLGPPGSGKGTYGKLLSKVVGFSHISAGDIIREEIKRDTPAGRDMMSYTNRGHLVPDAVVNGIMLPVIQDAIKIHRGYILDGFPRTIAQGEWLESRSLGPAHVVNIDLPNEAIVAKMMGRRMCPRCNANYNVAAVHFMGLDMPAMDPKVEGVCDECAAQLVIRSDDTEKIIQNRLEIYSRETSPLIQYYKDMGKLKTFKVIRGVKDMDKLIDLVRN